MLGRVEVFLRYLKRILSRSEWAIRLLRLSKSELPASRPGLVMVQIDGLSMTQFNRALRKKHLPFLEELLSKERYILRSFYSGLPSNTPAVQAELFYGIKGVVPAFSFLDRQSGRTVKMLDMAFVEEFEKRLKAQSPGLLEQGSSYSDIYTGGASESHCCWSRMGWEGVLWAVNPLVFPFLVLLYIDIFVRTVILVFVELFLAIVECMRGTLKGRLFFRELELVWQRSLVCVFLREFITAGACIDIMRGVPVIHLNFLGYDEQAHGRGPSSGFAHWSLRGIDDAIKRIYRVMNESPRRPYDLWVYSDHGQSKTTPYFVKYGRTIEEAVQELFSGASIQADNSMKVRRETTQSRVSILDQRKKKPASKAQAPLSAAGSPSVIVTAMGPLGHIYVKKTLTVEELHFYAKKLVSQIKVPLVLTKEANRLLAWTPRGSFIFPDEAEKILGKDHPFLEEIKEDLLRVCFHPDAGEFVIAGWCEGEEAISFPLEYGAHAGMSVEETHAFALLPLDAPIETPATTDYLRPLDLRKGVQHFLNSRSQVPFNLFGRGLSSKSLTLMSYNVHGCAGMDGQISTERIARVIARYNPDIIALQELDVGRQRSGRTDQVEMIARKLEMKYHFNPAFRWKDEQYGNAILSRYPMALIKSGSLPQLPDKRGGREPRGALWVAVEFGGKKMQVLNTHLSLWPRERSLQADALLSEEWLQHPDCQGPVVLCGDFNAFPGTTVHRKICHKLYDSQAAKPGHRPRSTWFGHYPVGRIDYVFVNNDLQVLSNTVPRTNLEKTASDHLPLITELDFSFVEDSHV
jgi:endonuclease/exonuclease/phosphatase family metal-dependent hydrolase